MLTALGKPEDVLQGFEAGADDYLPKPFELKIFQARLNGLLRRREWFQKEANTSKISDIFTVKTIDFDNLELKKRRNDSPDLDGSQTFALFDGK